MAQEKNMEDTTPLRLEELEIRNTYLERSVEELSERIFEQQKHLDRLESVVKQVSRRLRDMSPDSQNTNENERPPHY